MELTNCCVHSQLKSVFLQVFLNRIFLDVGREYLVAELRAKLPSNHSCSVRNECFGSRVYIPFSDQRRFTGIILIICCNQVRIPVQQVSGLNSSCNMQLQFLISQQTDLQTNWNRELEILVMECFNFVST